MLRKSAETILVGVLTVFGAMYLSYSVGYNHGGSDGFANGYREGHADALDDATQGRQRREYQS